MRVADHVVQARRQRLAGLLARHHYLSLGELCDRLDVSEPTARRDLVALAADRAIIRTRGGALVEYNQKFPSFRERLGRAAAVKRRLAAAASRLLKPDQTVWLDGGTTVYYVAEALADRRPAGLVVVTHNMPAAELLADLGDVAVLRASALSVVLADAVKFGRRAAEFLGRASEVDRILTDVSATEFEAAGLRPGQRLNITKGGAKP